MAASYGVSETSSAIRSPRLVSSSEPIGVSSEMVRCAAWTIWWIFSGCTLIASATSSGVGWRPSSWASMLSVLR